jgi:hypothetical protein
MNWFSAGIQTNPGANAILADTGAMPSAGKGTLQITLGANVAAVAALEHRNAANDATLNSQVIACAINQAFDTNFPNLEWVAGERFRVRLTAAIVGSAQASIFIF